MNVNKKELKEQKNYTLYNRYAVCGGMQQATDTKIVVTLGMIQEL